MGPQGAIWFETLSDKEGAVDKATWDAMRVGMACTTTDTLAEIKAEIEKLCSATACDYEKVAQILGKLEEHLQMIEAGLR